MNKITGTICPVIQFCYENSCKLIYSGSSTKFGDSESPYSICKEINSQIVNRLCSYLKINYAITYFYNVYGPNEISYGEYSTLIAKSIRAKKTGSKIIVSPPGTQKRNFTHVSDIINALIIIAENGYGDNYGIGSEKTYSVLDVMDLCGCEYEIGEKKEGNRMGSQLITKKTKLLGWVEKQNLKKYIIGQL